MSETPQEAQEGVADAVRGLSDNTQALVRHEIMAAQREMLDKAKQFLPAIGLLGAAGFFGLLSASADYRLSVRLLEKSLPPATAAFVAAAGYGAAAGAAGTVGVVRLRASRAPLPSATIRQTVATVAGTAKAMAGTAARTATDTAKAATGTAKATAGTRARKATDTAKAAGTTARKATGTTRKAAGSTAARTGRPADAPEQPGPASCPPPADLNQAAGQSDKAEQGDKGERAVPRAATTRFS